MSNYKNVTNLIPPIAYYFSFIYHILLWLTTSLIWPCQSGTSTSPYYSKPSILYISNQYIWPYQTISKFTNIPFQRSCLLTNGFIKHDLHVFCWTPLKHHKQLLQHIRLEICVAPPRWCCHNLILHTPRFGSWWRIHSTSSRRNPTTNLQHQTLTAKAKKIINCLLIITPIVQEDFKILPD